MPHICPLCTKQWFSSQSCLQRSICAGWIHHDNRLKCSGLTDSEFEEHIVDIYRFFECDHCVSERIAKSNNSVFRTLPFPVEYEDNIFGKPPKTNRKPDVRSMPAQALNKFIKQCENVNKQINSIDAKFNGKFKIL